MTLIEALMLSGGGVIAGVVNTLAGGGSLLTVPLLVMLGLPGTLANGTNRIGVLVMNLTAVWGFKREGVSGLASAREVALPILAGALLGAIAISQVSDAAFERMFGLVMLGLLVPTLRPPRTSKPGKEPSPLARFLLLFGIGLYGGAFQAGVGILLVLALSKAGVDLVRANSAKVMLTLLFTLVAVPVFIAEGQVEWLPALVLAVGYGIGGAVGARLAVRGGEKLIRPVLAASVVVLAVRMLGVF